jgi:hypothetical protein
MNELLRRYENRQSLRAVKFSSEAVNVTLSMKMVQIIELVSIERYEEAFFSISCIYDEKWPKPENVLAFLSK